MLRPLNRSVMFFVWGLLALHAAPNANADARQDATEIVTASGVSAGFFVHLGASDGELTAALRQNDSIQVHGLLTDTHALSVCRQKVFASGDYGNITFDLVTDRQLPYVDNLVNLLVADDLGEIPMEEVMRVLVPHGVAMVKQNGTWTKTVKP
ncbi:MAG: hypothetical protein MI861_05445, partial [Pirellulales bacterium]|nr:hypothetical protein [Pirellulales bacterium]